VTLGDVMRGDLPAILTFNYSDCPMLCNVQLTGLTTALPKVGTRDRRRIPATRARAMQCFRSGPSSAS